MASNQKQEEQHFAEAVLQGVGVKPTEESLSKMLNWMRAEGGNWKNSAKYNPLNTTLALPGAGNTGAQGNIKVYKSWEQGVDATVKTLNGSQYGEIRKALGSGGWEPFATAVNQSPWGTKLNAEPSTEAESGLFGILEGKIPGFSKEGGTEGAATGALEKVNPVNAIKSAGEALGEIVDVLTSPDTWLRVAEGIGGMILLAVGLKTLTKGSPAAQAAQPVQHVVRKAAETAAGKAAETAAVVAP